VVGEGRSVTIPTAEIWRKVFNIAHPF